MTPYGVNGQQRVNIYCYSLPLPGSPPAGVVHHRSMVLKVLVTRTDLQTVVQLEHKNTCLRVFTITKNIRMNCHQRIVIA